MPAGTTRHHGEIYADYGASTAWIGWAFPDVPNTLPSAFTRTDCTARFTATINGGHWDKLHWVQVFGH